MKTITAIDSSPMSYITRERAKFLWGDRIPRGKITMEDGDPGLGKSTIAMDIAARVSTASPFPDGKPMDFPGHVVLLNAEDGWGDTIRPRLEAAGADLERVHYFRGVQRKGADMYPPDIPGDLDALQSVVEEVQAELIVVDPLMAFLGSSTDSHRDHDVRRALAPLAELGEATGAAILIVRHLNKNAGNNPLYRGGGSIAIVGAARAAMMVGVDPNDDSQRILAMTKSNLAPLAPSLCYRLVPDDEYGCARIQWLGTVDTSAADLVAVRSDDDRTAEDEAVSFLMHELADGPRPGAEVKKEAGRSGISARTLQRGKTRLGVISRHEGSPGSVQQWVWELPIDGD